MSGRSSRGPRGEGSSSAWDPLRELSGLKERLNRVFESALRRGDSPVSGALSGWTPAVDLREEKERLVLTVELPGVARSSLKVRVEGHTLTIEGDRPEGRDARQAEHLRVERSYGPFARSIQLPAPVDDGAAEARFERGVLEVRLPKASRARSTAVRIRLG